LGTTTQWERFYNPFFDLKLDLLRGGSLVFFSDGHARHEMTRFYTDASGFDELDWEAIYATQWKNTENDPDRQRRKQAEYRIKENVPITCFSYFLTFDEKCKQKIESLQVLAQTAIPVKISKKAYYDHI
jgi:hypothetical protein